MGTPLKVVAEPYEIWVALAEASDPGLDSEPVNTTWRLITSINAMVEGGLKFTKSGDMLDHRTEGSNFSRKLFRQKEDAKYEWTMDETGAQNFATILGNTRQSIAATSTTAGYDKVAVAQGRVVKEYAFFFLGRTASTQMTYGKAYYYLPRGYISNELEYVGSKGEVAMFKVEVSALSSNSQPGIFEAGYFVEQTAAATGS